MKNVKVHCGSLSMSFPSLGVTATAIKKQLRYLAGRRQRRLTKNYLRTRTSSLPNLQDTYLLPQAMKYWSIWKLSDGVLITGKVSEIAASNLGLIMIMENS